MVAGLCAIGGGIIMFGSGDFWLAWKAFMLAALIGLTAWWIENEW